MPTPSNRKTTQRTGNSAQGRKRAQKSRNGRVTNAPVSRAVASHNRDMQMSMRKCGSDYLDVVKVDSLADGSIIFDLLIVPALLPQLSRVAKTYQKIKWNSLTFEMSSHMPTTTVGGYVMAFRPDPADELPGDTLERKRSAVSTPGSVKDSIWNSRRLTIKSGNGPYGCLPNKPLFTSPSAEVRDYSPGSFWMVTDGDSTGAGSFSVTVHWDVTLSVESYESQVEEGIPDTLQAAVRLFCYDGDQCPRSADTSSSAYLRWEGVFPEYPRPETNVGLRVGLTFGVLENGDASEDIEYSDYFEWHTDNYFYACTTSGGLAKFKSPTGNTQVFGRAQYKLEPARNTRAAENLSQSFRRLSLDQSRLQCSPTGGLSNRAYYVTSSRRFNPWHSPPRVLSR